MSPADRSLTLAIALIWTAAVVWLYWGHFPPDLSPLYFASRFYAAGAQDLVYASPARFFGMDHDPAWIAAVAAAGYPDETAFPFVYPPLWAAVLAPLTTRIDADTFFRLAYLLQGAMIAHAAWLGWDLMRRPAPAAPWMALALGLVATSMIGVQALHHNQAQITVAWATILAFQRLAHDRPVQAGLWLGLAAAIKVAPILLVILMLAEGQRRAALTAVLTAALLAAASFAIAGTQLNLAFVAQLRTISAQLAFTETNYSLKALTWAWALTLGGRPMDPGSSLNLTWASVWVNPATLAAALGGLALILWATRGRPADQRLQARLPAILIWLTFTSALSWAHHYLAPLLLAPALLAVLPRRTALPVLLLTGILLSAPFLVLMRPSGDLARLGPATLATLVLLALGWLLALPRRP